ncbi:MAG: hypothetical protein J5J00_08430 [Deltaproteobacteria bacterium]|nr:hypothetical protein [Deltaproteobacteria bacterium]
MTNYLRAIISSCPHSRKGSACGLSIIEVLVAMVLLGLVGLATAGSTISGLQANKRTEVTNFLHNIAISKIEEFAGMDVAQIDDGDDATETSVTTAGTNLTFTRVTEVTVKADQSRDVMVTVSCNDPRFTSTASYSSTFVLFE